MERTDALPTSTDSPPTDWLKLAALLCVLVATASGEYQLAIAVRFDHYVAAAVPGALDIYVVRALRVHRDVAPAVIAMIGVNAASHLVTAGLLPVSVPVVVAVSAIAPLVLWRVHMLRTVQQPAAAPAEQPVQATPEPAEVDPEPEDAAPAALPVASQVSPVINLDPGLTLKDAVLTVAGALGAGATSGQIATVISAAHWPGTTDATVRATLSRHRRDQDAAEAQQAKQWAGGYA